MLDKHFCTYSYFALEQEMEVTLLDWSLYSTIILDKILDCIRGIPYLLNLFLKRNNDERNLVNHRESKD